MSEELRWRVHAAAGQLAVSESDIAGVTRSGSRRRMVRRVTGSIGAVALVAAGWSTFAWSQGSRRVEAPVSEGPQNTRQAWLVTGDGPYVTGGYRFSNVEVRLAVQLDPTSDLQRAEVRFDLEWAGDDYPGTRLCTWEVFDVEGQRIGSATSEFSAGAPSYSEPVLKDRVDVSGDPRHVEISCGDKRLDDPDGHFEITEVGVESSQAEASSDYRVSFTYRWDGDGSPAPQRCDMSIFDSEGRLVAESTQEFDSMGEGPNRSWFEMDGEESTAGPFTASIDCRLLH